MSSRMFPCRVISAVVRPSVPHALSAGAISLRSTSSKSIPSLTPKGRTMKARVADIPPTNLSVHDTRNASALGGSHDIEGGWKMLRLDLFCRGNPPNVRELIHVHRIIH